MTAANILQVIGKVTRKSARVLGNELNLAKRVNRSFDQEFGQSSGQIGTSLSVRRPIRPTVNQGMVADVQGVVETVSVLPFTDPYNVTFALNSQELTMAVDDYFDKTGKPSIVALANRVEQVGHQLITQVFNAVGTPGTPLTSGPSGTSINAVGEALALLYTNDMPVGADDTTLIVGPQFNNQLVNSNLTYFNPGPEISAMYKKGLQGDFKDSRVFMNQLVQPHTNGVYGGTPTVATTVPANATYPANGVNQSTIATTGWTATTTSLNVGDIFTIAGVYTVNPQTKQNTGILQQFAVASQTVTDGSGNSTITVTPAVITTGGFQNVSQAPQAGAAITVLGASGAVTQNALAFHRDAFMLAAKELKPLFVGIGKTVKDHMTNIPIRCMMGSDFLTSQDYMRFDIYVAWATLYSQLACRIATT